MKVSALLSEADALEHTKDFITGLLKNSLFELEEVSIVERLDAYTFIMMIELYLEDIHIICIKTDLRQTLRKEDKLGYYLRDCKRRFWVEVWDDEKEGFVFTEIDKSNQLNFFKALSEEVARGIQSKAEVIPIKD